jgi:hypothetical protein
LARGKLETYESSEEIEGRIEKLKERIKNVEQFASSNFSEINLMFDGGEELEKSRTKFDDFKQKLAKSGKYSLLIDEPEKCGNYQDINLESSASINVLHISNGANVLDVVIVEEVKNEETLIEEQKAKIGRDIEQIFAIDPETELDLGLVLLGIKNAKSLLEAEAIRTNVTQNIFERLNFPLAFLANFEEIIRKELSDLGFSELPTSLGDTPSQIHQEK